MPQQQTGGQTHSRIRVREPQQFRVILHNDDFTTMDFVVMILSVVFRKDAAEAERIMLDVHRKGRGVAGIYSYDIAKSKTMRATKMARDAQFPLRITVEPAE